MAADLQPDIDAIEKAKGAMASAKALIDTIATRVQAAVDAAQANGATPEQLQPLTDEVATLNASSDDLAASVAANP
jgi:hypothetical protein